VRHASKEDHPVKIADRLDLSFVDKLDLGELRRCVDKLIEDHGEEATLELRIGRSKPDGEGDTYSIPTLGLVFRREETPAEREKRMKGVAVQF
jgi:hypothetical protein